MNITIQKSLVSKRRHDVLTLIRIAFPNRRDIIRRAYPRITEICSSSREEYRKLILLLKFCPADVSARIEAYKMLGI